MVMILGGVFLFFGLIMMFRGWTYTLRPDGPMALKRKAKNLQLGFPTDMRVWGRKVRRVGTILGVIGGAMFSSNWW
ncbi:MAG: hypothetical protein AB2A00_37980 [Myxococcota bacterium]